MAVLPKKRPADPEKAVRRDVEVLSGMVNIYCSQKHEGREKKLLHAGGKVGRNVNSLSVQLCEECGRLLLYAVGKRIICPHDPKPSCKNCPSHCYSDSNRDKIRDVMRFSGMVMIKKGRIGLLKKYFF